MPEPPWSPDQEDLVSDLMYLRKGRGLTLDRLRDAGTVIMACGGADQPIETVHERLCAALRWVETTPHGKALRAAFGLDGGQDDGLEGRRLAHAKSVRKQSGTVLKWENRAIEELALRLMSAFYATPPLPSQLPIPHGGFYIPAMEVVAFYEGRQFKESIQTRTITALLDNADHFIYGTYSPTELSDAVGAELEPPRQLPGGTLHKLVFDPPLRRGDTHTFRFTERVPEAYVEPSTITEDFSGQTFESPALHYRVELRFGSEKPAVVWGYHNLSRIERPGQPEDGQIIPMTDNGIVSAKFYAMKGGMCAGIAWRWEPNEGEAAITGASTEGGGRSSGTTGHYDPSISIPDIAPNPERHPQPGREKTISET